MGAMTLFYTSGILITLFLMLKSFENRRGARYFELFRSRLDALARSLRFIVVDVAPYKVVHNLAHVIASGAHIALAFVLKGVRIVERQLVRVANFIRGKKELHGKKAASSFLIETMEHKRNNQKDSKRFTNSE